MLTPGPALSPKQTLGGLSARVSGQPNREPAQLPFAAPLLEGDRFSVGTGTQGANAARLAIARAQLQLAQV